MSEMRRPEWTRLARREAATFFAVLITALLVVGPLSVISLTRDSEMPQREVVDGAHSDLVTPTSASFAVPTARSYLRRATTCSARSCMANAFLRDLAIAIAAVSLIAWRRYVAGRRTRGMPAPHHPGSIFFLRGPPTYPSHYSSACRAGDQPMDTTREDSLHAIRYLTDARAALRACITT
jgi:hypothetical protein